MKKGRLTGDICTRMKYHFTLHPDYHYRYSSRIRISRRLLSGGRNMSPSDVIVHIDLFSRISKMHPQSEPAYMSASDIVHGSLNFRSTNFRMISKFLLQTRHCMLDIHATGFIRIFCKSYELLQTCQIFFKITQSQKRSCHFLFYITHPFCITFPHQYTTRSS